MRNSRYHPPAKNVPKLTCVVPPAEDVHLAPGFSSSYDTPPFYPGDQASSGRLYSGDRYSDQVFKASIGDVTEMV